MTQESAVRVCFAAEAWCSSDVPDTMIIRNYGFVRIYYIRIGFGGLEVACWPLVPKFTGSNPTEAVGFLRAKNPQHAFLRRFAACKRSLELRGSRILDEICPNISRPRRVPPSAARGRSRRWT